MITLLSNINNSKSLDYKINEMYDEHNKDGMEIEPKMKSVDENKFYLVDARKSQAIVIHCADPRFQNAFRKFITEELGINHYSPIIIGGGAHAFGMQTLLPANFQTLFEQIKFFVEEAGLKQVIIVNHEDCKWYEKMKGCYPDTRLSVKGKLDLRKAALTIVEDFTGVDVRIFWAGLDGDNIRFSEVLD